MSFSLNNVLAEKELGENWPRADPRQRINVPGHFA
jgi:hypothetical protein